MTYPNGDKYEGEFTMGKKNGTGTFTFANGHVVSGSFENDYNEEVFKLLLPQMFADFANKHGEWVYEENNSEEQNVEKEERPSQFIRDYLYG